MRNQNFLTFPRIISNSDAVLVLVISFLGSSHLDHVKNDKLDRFTESAGLIIRVVLSFFLSFFAKMAVNITLGWDLYDILSI